MLKAGFKITEDSDSIWPKEFERYKEIYKRRSSGPDSFLPWREMENLNSVDQLKNKCKDYLESDFKKEKWEGQHHLNPFVFISEFCVGRNKVSEFFESVAKLKKTSIKRLDFNSDEEAWGKSADFLKSRANLSFLEIYFPKNLYKQIRDKEGWKMEAKNFCRNFEWDKEKHALDLEKGMSLLLVFRICTNANWSNKYDTHTLYDFKF